MYRVSLGPPVSLFNGYRRSFVEVTRPGREVNHTLLPSDEVKNERRNTSAHLVCLTGADKENLSPNLSKINVRRCLCQSQTGNTHLLPTLRQIYYKKRHRASRWSSWSCLRAYRENSLHTVAIGQRNLKLPVGQSTTYEPVPKSWFFFTRNYLHTVRNVLLLLHVTHIAVCIHFIIICILNPINMDGRMHSLKFVLNLEYLVWTWCFTGSWCQFVLCYLIIV
jgi:hypothetical protein